MNPIVRRGSFAQRTALLLIALIVAVAGAAVFAVPGYLDQHRTAALRAAVDAAGDEVRIGVGQSAPLNTNAHAAASAAALQTADQWAAQALPPELRGVLGTPSMIVRSASAGLEQDDTIAKQPHTRVDDDPPGFAVRAPYGSGGKLRAVAGQQPPKTNGTEPPGPATDDKTPQAAVVYGWISQAAADKLHVSVGDVIKAKSDHWVMGLTVQIAGIFAPEDPTDPWWHDPATGGLNALAAPQMAEYTDIAAKESKPYWQADLLLDNLGAQRVGWITNMSASWSFPLKPEAVTAGNAANIVNALTRYISGAGLPPTPRIILPDSGGFTILQQLSVSSALPGVLNGYLRDAGTSMVVMSLGLAVLVAVSVGVLALAVRLLIHRQRADLTVCRARGASLPELARGVGWQVVLAALPAAVAAMAATIGAGYAHLDVGSALAVVAVAAVAFALTAGQTVGALRGSTGSLGFLSRRLGQRTDAAARLGIELFALLLLGGQIMTLRLRGLGSATTGIDPVVATLPVTVALAAGVVLLRVAPLVPRFLAWLLGAGRGATGFVATAAARRESVIGGLASVVILATLSGAVFGSTFTRSLTEARSDTQWQAIGGAAHVNDPFAGFGNSLMTTEDLAKIRKLPGVTAVAGGAVDTSANFAAGAAGSNAAEQPVTVLALDVADYLKVIKGTPLDTSALRDALGTLIQASSARPLSDYQKPGDARSPVPALLSSGAAPGTAGTVTGTVLTAGTPVSVVGTVPMLPKGVIPQTQPVLVMDYQVLKAAIHDEPVRGDAWVGGTGAGLAALNKPGLLSEPGDQVLVQANLADTGGSRKLDVLTERVYAGETVLEGLLCALAVLLTLAAGSGARRRAAAFLATMGFGRGRLRRIALLEALPLLVVVTAGGIASGLGTVPLLAGSVNLASLAGLSTSDLPVRTNLVFVAIAAVAIPGVALLAVLGEAVLRRPMTLVSTLRAER